MILWIYGLHRRREKRNRPALRAVIYKSNNTLDLWITPQAGERKVRDRMVKRFIGFMDFAEGGRL
jgi:hypothetical protein